GGGRRRDAGGGLPPRPLARSVGGLPAVAASAAKSIEGVSLVRLTLRPDADPALALAQANSLILTLLPALPPGCLPPLAQVGDPGDATVLGFLSVQNPNLDEARLSDIARQAV